MTDLQPLMILLERHDQQRDLALTEHQRAQAASAAASTQATQLREYRREYEQRWSAQFAREGKIEVVRAYQSFMERLTQTIEQQQQIAERAAQQLDRALAALRACELRCASVRKLIERRLEEQRLVTERRDQQQTDEFAARAVWTRLGTTRPTRLM